MRITDDALKAIESFVMPESVGFGKVLLPIMAVCEYKRGVWSDLEIRPYAKLELDPTAKVLHYGQEIFEGMKAYNYKGNGPNLFRPRDNQDRFNFSAKRMAMPEVPNNIFTDAVAEVARLGQNFIPKRGGESLYLRPFMIATECNLGIKPSEEFLFMVIASPVESYFSGGSYKILIEREMVRASKAGMGNAKTGGNYAGALNSGLRCQKLGLHQSLWLSAIDRDSIEELSGMNFFAVIDGELHTPELTDTILNGITRNSLIQIARSKGINVVERRMSVKDLIEDIKSQRCTEVFSCGTAAIITPICSLHEEDGTFFNVKEEFGPTTRMLRETLLGIQEKTLEDQFGWVYNL